MAQQLFEGSLDPALSRNVVQEIGARFVLADCEATPVLRGYLAPITVLVKRFGCASVYQVRLPGRSS